MHKIHPHCAYSVPPVDQAFLIDLEDDVLGLLQGEDLRDWIDTGDESKDQAILCWLEAHSVFDLADFIFNTDLLRERLSSEMAPLRN